MVFRRCPFSTSGARKREASCCRCRSGKNYQNISVNLGHLTKFCRMLLYLYYTNNPSGSRSPLGLSRMILFHDLSKVSVTYQMQNRDMTTSDTTSEYPYAGRRGHVYRTTKGGVSMSEELRSSSTPPQKKLRWLRRSGFWPTVLETFQH